MSTFEVLVLKGLWLILRSNLQMNNYLSSTDQVIWTGAVSEAIDEKLPI